MAMNRIRRKVIFILFFVFALFLSFGAVACKKSGSKGDEYSFGQISNYIEDSSYSSSVFTSQESSFSSSLQSSSEQDSASYGQCECVWIYYETTKELTCTTDGEYEYICAKGCGNRKWETVPCQGHTPGTEERENLKAVEPTCKNTGFTKGEYCETCGETIVARTELPMLDHDLIGGVECRWCELCTLVFQVDDEEYPSYYICMGYARADLRPRNIVIPDTHEDLPYKGLVLPVREIAERAFEREYGLNSITLGENIQRIGEFAFNECHNLVEVCNKSDITIEAGSMENIANDGSIGMYVKAVYTSDDYESKICNKDGFVIYEGIEETSLLIGYKEVSFQFHISPPVPPLHITIPEGVTEIHSYAFAYVEGIESITLADSIDYVHTYAFSQSYNLKKVVFGNGEMTIDTHIFFRWKEETLEYIEPILEEVVATVPVTLERKATGERQTFAAGENFKDFLTALLDEKHPLDPLDDVTNGNYRYIYTPNPTD